MPGVSDTRERFRQTFGGEGEIGVVSVPGRVNLIGEHIDYHGLPVLPIAIQRYVRVAFRARQDRLIRAVSTAPYGAREFEWTPELTPAVSGDWQNYLRAAAQIVGQSHWTGRPTGIDAVVVSDLPAAAGLSSSTALLVAFQPLPHPKIPVLLLYVRCRQGVLRPRHRLAGLFHAAW